jgi:lipoprotein LprG
VAANSAPTSTPTPSPTPTPTPADFLKRAADRFNQLDSLHFNLQIDGKVALDSQGLLQLHSADGDLKRPDQAQANAKISVGGANVNMKMVAIGPDQYITNFLTGKWEKAPPDLGYNPAVLFDPQRGIAGVLTAVQNPTVVGSDNVNGQDAMHLTGKVPKAAVDPITGSALTSDPVDADIWLSKQNYDLLKIVLHDQGNAGTPTTWTLTTSNFNQPVTITKPNV